MVTQMKGKGAAASLDRSHGLRKGRLPDYPVVNTIGTSGGSRGGGGRSRRAPQKNSLINYWGGGGIPVYQNASRIMTQI